MLEEKTLKVYDNLDKLVKVSDIMLYNNVQGLNLLNEKARNWKGEVFEQVKEDVGAEVDLKKGK